MTITVSYKEVQKAIQEGLWYDLCYMWAICSCGRRIIRKVTLRRSTGIRDIINNCKCGTGIYIADIIGDGGSITICV